MPCPDIGNKLKKDMETGLVHGVPGGCLSCCLEEKEHESGEVIGNQDREGGVGAYCECYCEEILAESVGYEEPLMDFEQGSDITGIVI